MLKAALEAEGYTNVKVWWEHIGPAMEMCGHSGGYVFNSDQEDQIPIGLSYGEARRAVTETYNRAHLNLNGLLNTSGSQT